MNELRDHPNLYLRQHGTNPIHWKEWSSNVWELAHQENKLVIVSIGYSACHWCHVMEKECFENDEVALYTNARFISIKVDRETRPDIDQNYMNALHLMGKQGGWPLNCICLPDGTPIFGGTYFPKTRWLQVLSELNELFQNRQETLTSFAIEMNQALLKFSAYSAGKIQPGIDHDSIQSFVSDLDFEWGGTAGHPKFPMPPLIQTLLCYGTKFNHKASLRWCQITLDKIKFGGIHDLIQGGISRYSVDHRWHVPHFEKMLFDNTQLLSTFAQAHLIFPEQEYDQVMMGIHDWLMNEMRQPSGLMSSTMDADSEGEEGKYYVFSEEDINLAFRSHFEAWNAVFDFKNHSYWEDGKIVLSAKTSFSLKDPKWLEAQSVLRKMRQKKIKPTTDHKIITSWNAQAVIAYCDASDVYPHWIQYAEDLYLSMQDNLKINGKWTQGLEKDRTITPLLFDTLAWIQKACIELFLKTTQWKYIIEAIEIFDQAEEYRQPSTLYALNKEAVLLKPIIETHDNVVASSNAIWAENLYWLSIITADLSYAGQCKEMMACMSSEINQMGYCAHWNKVLQFIESEAGIVVACLPEIGWKKNKSWLHKTIEIKENIENIFLQGKWQSKTQYSLCTLATCYPPVHTATDIR
jgi:uncharacterized protein YyaL (SSP411 family)